MKLKKAFERKETKYTMSEETFLQFQTELNQWMQVDEFGLHTIMSLYFDTPDYVMIQHSMEKPKYKEKFRVRSYGVPDEQSTIFLESKKKIKGIVYKRRIPVSYQAYHNWQTGQGLFPESPDTPQINRELKWLFAQCHELAPRVLIAYDRMSYFYEEDPDFRVTFDQRIRYRDTDLDLTKGSGGALVAPEIGVLMEVKAMGAYPLWFVHLLTKYGLKKDSFSKYAFTYRRHLADHLAPIEQLREGRAKAASLEKSSSWQIATMSESTPPASNSRTAWKTVAPTYSHHSK